jgi:hypothetical protein
MTPILYTRAGGLKLTALYLISGKHVLRVRPVPLKIPETLTQKKILRTTSIIFMIRVKRKEIQHRFQYSIGGGIQNGWFALLQKTNKNGLATTERRWF